MSRSDKKKMKDDVKLSALKRDIAKEVSEQFESLLKNSQTTNQANPPRTGLYNTEGIDINLKYNESPNEKVIKKGDAYITFGADKPSGTASGYGGKGATGAARIDLVVGRLSPSKPKDGSSIDNSFQADAARIYISQLTDIDKNFGVDKGKSGFMEGRSGVGIKADGVRIIGREGVKIVTGRQQGTNEKNSIGGKMLPAPLIELIAGNNTEPRRILGSFFSGEDERYDPLQGVVLGHNMTKALGEIVEMQQDIIGIMRRTKVAQRNFNIAMMVASALPPQLAILVMSAAYTAFIARDIELTMKCWETTVKGGLHDINYLQPFGYRYIESRNVKAT
tara:strand:- start:1573 stop:2577 length:1005 start_codon:yes stop_codon:yes gene_type:complete